MFLVLYLGSLYLINFSALFNFIYNLNHILTQNLVNNFYIILFSILVKFLIFDLLSLAIDIKCKKCRYELNVKVFYKVILKKNTAGSINIVIVIKLKANKPRYLKFVLFPSLQEKL